VTLPIQNKAFDEKFRPAQGILSRTSCFTRNLCLLACGSGRLNLYLSPVLCLHPLTEPLVEQLGELFTRSVH